MPSGSRDLRGGSADEAAQEAVKGAVNGALRWSVYTAVAAVAAQALSPLFRGLTIQFKVYLFMCPVTIGSMVEADRRLRMYEMRVRMQRWEAKQKMEREQLREELGGYENGDGDGQGS